MNGLISFSIRAAAYLKCQYFQFNSNEDLLLLAMTSAVTGSYHTTCLFQAPSPFLSHSKFTQRFRHWKSAACCEPHVLITDAFLGVALLMVQFHTACSGCCFILLLVQFQMLCWTWPSFQQHSQMTQLQYMYINGAEIGANSIDFSSFYYCYLLDYKHRVPLSACLLTRQRQSWI